MDKNKIKMKYHMGIWKELPNYPTPEDIIFELNTYLLRDNRPDGEFTEQTFNSFLPSDWENSSHGTIIKNFFESGVFGKQKTTQGGKTKYKIINNPHF